MRPIEPTIKPDYCADQAANLQATSSSPAQQGRSPQKPIHLDFIVFLINHNHPNHTNKVSTMSNSNEVNWDKAIWDDINDAVKKEMGKVRIVQKVFPTMLLDENPTEVVNDVIIFDRLTREPSIREGQTKPLFEAWLQFSMSSTQVSKEPDCHICKTLACMGAKALALAEDTIIFQGEVAGVIENGGIENSEGRTEIMILPGGVQQEQIASMASGLLGEADPKDANDKDSTKVTEPIFVPILTKSETGAKWGEHVFSAVAEGIAALTSKGQAPNYALFLPTLVYSDTFIPPSESSLVTTADRIKPLVEGGFHGTGTLPPYKGLLVALGGNPTSIYVGREATAEFLRKAGARYIFRVVERIQFVARDPRALVMLEFEQPSKASEATPRKRPSVRGAVKHETT